MRNPKDLLKEFNALTDNNDHSEAARLLVNSYGSTEAKKKINSLTFPNKKQTESDIAERNTIVRPYLKMAKNFAAFIQ